MSVDLGVRITLDHIVSKNFVATMWQLGSYCWDNGDNDDNGDNGKSRDILHKHGDIFAFTIMKNQVWCLKMAKNGLKIEEMC